MTILDTGLNKERDLVYADLTNGIAGTSATAVSFTDTGLIAERADTDNTLVKALFDKGFTVTHIVGPAEANGFSLTEWAYKNSSDEYYTRSLTAPVIKTANIQVTMISGNTFDRE